MRNFNVNNRQASFLLAALFWLAFQPCLGQSNIAGIPENPLGTYLTGLVATTGDKPTQPLMLNAIAESPFYYPQAGEYKKDIKNIITLSINEETSKYIPEDFTVTVSVDINYGPDDQHLTLFRNQSVPLTVSYNKAEGAKYNAKAYYVLSDAEYVTVKIKSISPSPGNTLSNSVHVEDLVTLSNEMKIVRYFSFDAATELSGIWSATVNEDKLDIVWDHNRHAYGYQLEWRWAEDGVASDNNLSEEFFRDKSTRVDLQYDQLSYSIPLLYEGVGKLNYRVRPVSYSENGTRMDGMWAQGVVTFTGHESSLNWQATTNFAERGKNKSVIQYADGSLRTRQTVTKDNVTNTVVTAETFYDGEGRPAIQILPAPSMASVIKYRQGLNLFNLQTEDINPAAFFDIKTTAGSMTPALQTIAGSTANYYSSSNPEINIGPNKAIPDAEGFPYTQTTYMQDGTGRIQSQGGVGPNYQIGSGKETKYFYGNAQQEELDALFGTEVGNAKHYFKNMVQDANGQLSVSYVDMHGRTIATALAGDRPSNLTALASNNYSTVQAVERQLLDKTTNITKGNAIESVNSLLVSGLQNYTFTYDLTPESLQMDVCSSTTPSTLCYECRYDLEISIMDQSGGELPIVRKFTNLGIAPTDACSSGSSAFAKVDPEESFPSSVNNHSISFSQQLGIGSYMVRKTLTISESSLQTYKELYISKALCKNEQALVDSVKNAMMLTSNCNVPVTLNCQSCKTALGSSSDYQTAYLSKLGITSPSPELLAQIAAEFSIALSKCNLLCTNISHELSSIREMMEEDTKPYTGQYSMEAPFHESPRTMYDKYNIAPTTNSSILNHPEYQRLLFAESLPAECYDWLTRFTQSDYTTAQLPANNYFNPLTGDPLLAVNSQLLSDMSDAISNYGGSGISMWQIAYGDARCKTEAVDQRQGCYTLKPSDPSGFTSSTLALTAEEKAQVWNLFKGLYAAQRARMLNKYIATQRPLPAGDDEDLVEQGYHVWFPKSDQIVGTELAGIDNSMSGVWPTHEQPYNEMDFTLPAGNTVEDEYDSRCSSYINMWKDRLLECPELANHLDIITTIVNAMKAVCVNGSDQSNPYGSSSVSPSTPGSVTDRSFEGVIKRVFTENGLLSGDKYLNGLCNPFVIEWPKPYGANPKLLEGEMTGQVDNCNCDQFKKLKQEAVNANVDVNSYSAFKSFVETHYNQTITSGMFDGLKRCPATAACSNCGDLQNVIEGYFASLSGNPVASCLNFPTTLLVSSRSGITTPLYEARVSIEFLPGFESNFNDNFLTVIHTCDLEANCHDQFTQYYNSYFNSSPAADWAQISALYSSNGILLEDICTYRSMDCGTLHRIECLFKGQGNSGGGQARSSNDCTTEFTNFFNSYFHNTLNYTWANLLTLYANQGCDNNLENTICNANASVPGGCTGNSQVIALTHAEPLPDILKCGFTANNGCITCKQITEYATAFTTAFAAPADALPYFTGTIELTPAQIAQNENFARFINYKTGFQFTWKDYAVKLSSTGCNLTHDNTTAVQTVICADPTRLIHLPQTTIDPCAGIKLQAEAIGKKIYEERKEFLINEMEAAYREKCLSAGALEHFKVSYKSAEYHYTLYYYDLAGNLVKTVPPKGVTLLNTTQIAAVQTSRNNNYVTDLPAIHSFATSYRYNSLNQVTTQSTPDAGTSKFGYDWLGKLVVSQNSQQEVDNKFSYTVYDELGRIKEVGQKTKSTSNFPAVNGDYNAFTSWLYDGVNNKEQVTRTTYDTKSPTVDPAEIEQLNLRNRVSFTQYFATDPDNGVVNPGDPNNTTYHNATYYSYDVHGNVDQLLQDYKGLSAMTSHANQFKKIFYRYDLVSGKVNAVQYQPGYSDAFYHRYEYDAENRLTYVYTSRDNIVEEKDARYEYYKHGPLARMVLGDQQVQGVDYAYTLQGWLKGINSTSLNTLDDIGQDGASSSTHAVIARDVYGFALHYYDNGSNLRDYKPIGGSNANNFARPSTGIGFSPISLFNGNIAGISMNNGGLAKAPASSTNSAPLFYKYQYDQLNRLLGMQAYSGMQVNNNTWPASLSTNNDFYKESISYDANGNIINYSRNGADNTGGQSMDQLHYKYYYTNADRTTKLPYEAGSAVPSGGIGTNQLAAVTDAVADNAYADDLDNQPDADNYSYDKIGNLIGDKKEGLTNITWTVYGKISHITKFKAGVTTNIDYTYDAAGNRISKTVNGKNTIYVRDASGNVMSVYEEGNTSINSGHITQSEVHLYGSSRLGIFNVKLDLTANTAELYNFERGDKFFELSNHLGNVLVTVSDKKLQHSTDNTTVDYYNADVVTANDYYPFGSQMPGRKYSQVNSSYRYGFNGKEKSDEVYSDGNVYDYGFRIYNPRIGRFLSVDPLSKSYPWYTPYQFSGNKPINSIDVDGREDEDAMVVEAEKTGKTLIKYTWIRATEEVAEEAAKTATARGLGVTIVKSFGRGLVLNLIWEIFSSPSTPPQGIAKELPKYGSKTDDFWRVWVGPGRNFPLPPLDPAQRPQWLADYWPENMPINLPNPGKLPKIDSRPTDDDNNEYVTLYRGVSETVTPGIVYDLAEKGIAYPKGLLPGHTPGESAEAHTYGDNETIYTSWSLYKTEAEKFARGKSQQGSGVVLSKRFKLSQLTQSQASQTEHFEHEGEYLVPGVVTGANTTTIQGTNKTD